MSLTFALPRLYSRSKKHCFIYNKPPAESDNKTLNNVTTTDRNETLRGHSVVTVVKEKRKA
jgi:hypothetical protein